MRSTRFAWVASMCASFMLACGGDDTGADDDGTGADADVSDIDAAGSGIDAGGGGGVDAGAPDALLIMSIFDITPVAASRQVDTTLTVRGFNIADGASLVLDNCDTDTSYDLSSTVVVAGDGQSMTAELAADPTREQGVYSVTVTNPDSQTDVLECAFRVLAASPPTVTDVLPASAFRGISGDGVNSDQSVTIVGTGFQSTPAVKWVKTDASISYDALFVGFVSDTELTAIVPSETLGMAPGEYNVVVTNPDLLSATWIIDDGMGGQTPGIFTITDTPPPDIEDISPSRIENGSCTSTIMTISGSNFAAGATAFYVATPGDACVGSIVDANGNTLCPIVVDGVDPSGTSMTAHFDPCPQTAAYPIAVFNPDGQADYFFSVEITPSSDGHLNTGAFEILDATLVTPRWRHATVHGFDAFGHAHLFVAGGQDGAGGVLGTVESSQLNVLGTPGPFRIAQQYGGLDALRVDNTLVEPRQGATLVRVGRDLFSIGGAAAATDVTDPVSASATVERARILSFEEMPAMRFPSALGGDGLPLGTWYYQVSAIGPWGESLGSREVVLIGAEGVNEVCWNDPVLAGATSFNVYRSLASDGRAGSASLIAAEVAGDCFTDDGAEALTPAPGNLRGTPAAGAGLAEGEHAYRVSAVLQVGGETFETYAGYAAAIEVTAADVTAGNAAIALSWDPVAADEYRVYKRVADGSFVRLDTGTLTDTTFTDAGTAAVDPVENPRAQVAPLAPGSLSLWDAVSVPAMNVAREGLDGIVINMDPASSGGLVARILVAGGRTDNTGDANTYLGTAESLGVFEDGTVDMMWTDETPEFTFPRAYFALVTTQGRNETDFPPPPEEPPCGDLDGDGFISCDCAPPDTPADQLDCNDADPGTHPGAEEVCGDGIDQDCDMGCTGVDVPCACEDDLDGDGHLSMACGGDDCCDVGTDGSLGCSDPNAPGIHPGSVEICNDGIDQDCDGVDPPCACADDLDGDGHVSIECGGDDCCDTGSDTSFGCNDMTAPDINPDQMEICSNGVDDDCDGAEAICASPTTASWPAPGPDAVATTAARSAPAPSTTFRMPRPRPPGVVLDVAGDEPVFVLAVFGDDVLATSSNQGRQDFEACSVNAVTGLLDCAQWAVQNVDDTKFTFGADALLYFSFMYPFYGVNRETVATVPSTRTFHNSAISRFTVNDPAGVTGNQVLGTRQSASTTFEVNRSYYQMSRLMSFVYVVGGWAEAHTIGGVDVPEGPTGSVERHQQ